MKKTVNVVVSGKVQGVWFRANTKNKAEQLGVTGWVKNSPGGTVEACFEGDEHQVQEMIEWCHRGPPRAKVEKVEVKNQESTRGFDNFSIKYRS